MHAKMFGILHVQVSLQTLQGTLFIQIQKNIFFLIIIISEIKLYDSTVSIDTLKQNMKFFFFIKKNSAVLLKTSGLSKKKLFTTELLHGKRFKNI